MRRDIENHDEFVLNDSCILNECDNTQEFHDNERDELYDALMDIIELYWTNRIHLTDIDIFNTLEDVRNDFTGLLK